MGKTRRKQKLPRFSLYQFDTHERDVLPMEDQEHKYDHVAEEQRNILESWQAIQREIGRLHPIWLGPMETGIISGIVQRD